MAKKICAVCACPVGVAHTYMAADKLAAVAKKMGYEIKVETQGMEGIEDELTDDDLRAADYIIMANDIAIRGMDRFEGYEDKMIDTSLHEALHNTQALLDSLA